LITVYLGHHFQELFYKKKSDLSFKEDDYKRLFEYSLDKKRHESDEESDDDLIIGDQTKLGLFIRRKHYK